MPNTNNLSYSSNGLKLTELFEALRLTAYQDSGGVWTIGYGHTGTDVGPGLTITEQRAGELLLQDVAGAVSWVNQLVVIALTQNQFDALVDFVFNVGSGNFKTSTLLKNLNAGDLDAAAAQFLVWDHVNGAVSPGLLKRRQAEMALFQSATAAAQSA